MNVLSTLFEYGASLFDAILVVWFITRFNEKSFKIKINPFWIPALVLIYAYSIISDNYLSDNIVLSTVLYLVLYIAYAMLIERNKRLKAFFSAISFEVILILINTSVLYIVSASVGDFAAALQGQENYTRFVFLLLVKILLFSACKLLLRVFSAEDSVDFATGTLAFLFTALTIVGLAGALYISTNFSERTIQTATFIITIAFTLANVVLYVLISQMIKLQRHKVNEKVLTEKLRNEQARYEEMTAAWSDARKLRHDMKHHLTVIKNYLQENRTAECEEYVSKLEPSIVGKRGLAHSDNNIIDYMVNAKFGGLKDTVVLITGSVGDLSDIEDADLASLFGNIFDNAAEAVVKSDEKRIELFFDKQNSSRIIVCKNTVNDSVLKNNKELKTTKDDKEGHGLGIEIIKRIVAKYGGMVDFFEEKNEFGVQVILPINK